MGTGIPGFGEFGEISKSKTLIFSKRKKESLISEKTDREEETSGNTIRHNPPLWVDIS